MLSDILWIFRVALWEIPGLRVLSSDTTVCVDLLKRQSLQTSHETSCISCDNTLILWDLRTRKSVITTQSRPIPAIPTEFPSILQCSLHRYNCAKEENPYPRMVARTSPRLRTPKGFLCESTTNSR